jgi:hypothetical protein
MHKTRAAALLVARYDQLVALGDLLPQRSALVWERVMGNQPRQVANDFRRQGGDEHEKKPGTDRQ